MEVKRLTALKTNVKNIMQGQFHPAEGFNPAYVLTPKGTKASRVRILGNVMNKFISEDGNYGFIVIDDESETTRVKIFKNTKMIEDIEVGDVVDVFGKIREYNSEVYIMPEIIRKIEDPNFLILRMAELAKINTSSEKNVEKVQLMASKASDLDEVKKLAQAEGIDEETVENVVGTESKEKKGARDSILNIIETLDEGDGAEYTLLMEKSGMEEAVIDEIINDLLSEGTCYEPRPGRIKRL